MPPPTPNRPVNREDWGAPAAEYLAERGIVPSTPAIRSSDYRLLVGNPLLYFLKRRLRIDRIYSWSEALSRGSWFHTCAELDTDLGAALPNEAYRDRFDTTLTKRLAELRTMAGRLQVSPEGTDALLQRERVDAYTALGWYVGASRTALPSYPSFRAWLNLPRYKILGREVQIEYPFARNTTALIQVDLLLLHAEKKVLYAVDYKTSSQSLVYRLSFCPTEFQTQFYTDVLRQALQSGMLHSRFPDLPRDVTFAGIFHLAISKPNIKFGASDRHFTESQHTITRGPRKGVVETRRDYFGEPDPALFFRRVTDHMMGVGQYADLNKDRQANPAVNSSFSPASLLDGAWGDVYRTRRDLLTTAATRSPYPLSFPPADTIPRDENDPYAPFLVTSPYDWPTIMAQSPNLTVLSQDQSDRRETPTDE